MVPGSIKMPMPHGFVFPAGALFLSVEPRRDFNRPAGAGEDNQERDEHGVRVWSVRVMDQDPEAGRFGRSPEVKVFIASAHQPVPPEGVTVAGGVVIRPVEFTDLVGTPWVSRHECKALPNREHKCRARQAWSLRASGMVAPGSVS